MTAAQLVVLGHDYDQDPTGKGVVGTVDDAEVALGNRALSFNAVRP